MYNKKVLLFSFMTLVCHFTTTAKRAGADNLNYYVDPSVESFPIESISQSSSLQFITHGKPGFLYINGK